jgi:hypothetical protein
MFTNSNAVKHKTLYAPRALLDVYALGQLKTLGPRGPRPFKTGPCSTIILVLCFRIPPPPGGTGIFPEYIITDNTIK